MPDHDHACEIKEARQIYCCNHGCEKNEYCGLYSASQYIGCGDIIYVRLGDEGDCDRFIDTRSPFLRALFFIGNVIKNLFLVVTAPLWGIAWIMYYVAKSFSRRLDPDDVKRIASNRELVVYGFAFRRFGIGWAIAKKKENADA